MKEVVAALQKIKQQAIGRVTGFVVGNTSDIFIRGRLYATPVRDTPELIFGGVVVRDVATARAVARLIDGKVDYVFVDDEKKIRSQYYGPNDAGNIEKTLRGIIKKSKLLTYKGNDLTVEAVDALVCSITPEVSGTNVAVIGMGNFGSKVALKLVERGMHVSVFRRDQKKLKVISAGLNQIKSEHTISHITPAKSIKAACKDAQIVIAVTNEKAVVTRDMLGEVAPVALLIDAGKGCFADDVVSDPSCVVYRVDVSIMQKHLFLGLIQTHAHFGKQLGQKEIPKLGVTLVSIGLLAAKGEVIVDDIEKPKMIIGVSAGGGVLERYTPEVEQKISAVNKFFKIK